MRRFLRKIYLVAMLLPLLVLFPGCDCNNQTPMSKVTLKGNVWKGKALIAWGRDKGKELEVTLVFMSGNQYDDDYEFTNLPDVEEGSFIMKIKYLSGNGDQEKIEGLYHFENNVLYVVRYILANTDLQYFKDTSATYEVKRFGNVLNLNYTAGSLSKYAKISLQKS